ncbi:MAG: hypothetical protein ACRDSR_05330 [Pseudonocardiaceae bacterium]
MTIPAEFSRRLGSGARRRRCRRPRGAGGRPDRDPACRLRRGPSRHLAHDLRVIARRVPRPPGKPAKLGGDADWEYGAFATNTPTGQTQWLDARHRTQAHVEDRVKQLKACGARNLPSIDYHRNTAWLQPVALATSLTAWL